MDTNSTTPAPAGEYVRKASHYARTKTFNTDLGREVVEDLEACERALEAARAENEGWAKMHHAVHADAERADKERDSARAALMDLAKHVVVHESAEDDPSVGPYIWSEYEDEWHSIDVATAAELAKAKEAGRG